jgi:hypothetical protein
MYHIVHKHVASVIAHASASKGAELSRFIKDEFEAFLECGILAHGFVRLRRAECEVETVQGRARKRGPVAEPRLPSNSHHHRLCCQAPAG